MQRRAEQPPGALVRAGGHLQAGRQLRLVGARQALQADEEVGAVAAEMGALEVEQGPGGAAAVDPRQALQGPGPSLRKLYRLSCRMKLGKFLVLKKSAATAALSPAGPAPSSSRSKSCRSMSSPSPRASQRTEPQRGLFTSSHSLPAWLDLAVSRWPVRPSPSFPLCGRNSQQGFCGAAPRRLRSGCSSIPSTGRLCAGLSSGCTSFQAVQEGVYESSSSGELLNTSPPLLSAGSLSQRCSNIPEPWSLIPRESPHSCGSVPPAQEAPRVVKEELWSPAVVLKKTLGPQ